MGRALVLAKYLAKNYILNPLLLPAKRHKVAVTLAVAGFALLMVTLFLLPSQAPEQGPTLRDVLHDMGLNRESAEWLVGLVSSLFLYSMLVRSPSPLIAMEEAEIEVLLAQPIEMREYYAAKLLVDVINMIWLMPAFLGVFPLVMELTGSVERAVATVIAIEVFFLYLDGVTKSVWNLKMRGRDWSRWMDAAVSLLLIAGVLQSALTWEVSPLLMLPVWVPVKSLVCTVALSCGLPSLLLYLVASVVLAASFLLLAYATSDVLSPEVVSTLKAKSPVVRGVEFSSRSKAPLEHLVLPMLRSRDNVVALVLIPAAALAGGALNRTFGSVDDPVLLGFMVGMFLVIVVLSLITDIGEDLVGLWIYRVYSVDMRPLGRALIIKYSYRMAIPLAVISAFTSGVTGSPAPLGLLCVFSSAIVLTAFLMTLPIVYFLPRRRVVRWSPLGHYTLDSLVQLLVLMPISATAMGFFFLTLYLSIVGWEALTVASISSSLISILMAGWLGDQLGDLLYSVDVAG